MAENLCLSKLWSNGLTDLTPVRFAHSRRKAKPGKTPRGKALFCEINNLATFF
jgi:hypothetical protein